MKTIDITIDFETCALCPTAAVMSVGAVAWDRKGIGTPFFMQDSDDDMSLDLRYMFSRHIDLRSAFVDGFTFDQNTADWWSRQSSDAKKALLANDDTPLLSIDEVVRSLFAWIEMIKQISPADEVCLWSQGSDFDLAILRNICQKYNIDIPIKYTNFRDHRTYFLELARLVCDHRGLDFSLRTAYSLVKDYGSFSASHDPIFDCKRSIYSLWQMLSIIDTELSVSSPD